MLEKHPVADLSGVEACAPEIARFRGYCAWLITFTNSPCNRAAPDPVACLGAQGVDITPDILRPKSRPRAARSRRRHAHTTVRGKSSDPDDGGDGASSKISTSLRRAQP
jgi:hypothetical protein